MGLGQIFSHTPLGMATGLLTGGAGQFNRGNNEYRGVDSTGWLGQGANYQQYGNDQLTNLGLDLNSQARQANDQPLVSQEQLRQGLAQNIAGQRSMAAGASPANQSMAARLAMINAGRLGAGYSGQQALAAMQEHENLQRLNLQRQQLQSQLWNEMANRGLQSNLGLEQARTARFGALLGTPTPAEQMAGLGKGLLQMGAMAA